MRPAADSSRFQNPVLLSGNMRTLNCKFLYFLFKLNFTRYLDFAHSWRTWNWKLNHALECGNRNMINLLFYFSITFSWFWLAEIIKREEKLCWRLTSEFGTTTPRRSALFKNFENALFCKKREITKDTAIREIKRVKKRRWKIYMVWKG